MAAALNTSSLILEGPPMWTQESRARYNRSKLRYPSDLTDEEWAYVEPLIPPAKRAATNERLTCARWSTR